MDIIEQMESFIFYKSSILAVMTGILSILPAAVVSDSKIRKDWCKKLLAPLILSVIFFNGIMPIVILETFNTGTFFELFLMMNSILISLWTAARWNLNSVDNRIGRYSLIVIRGALLYRILYLVLEMFSLFSVMIITGRGGA